MVNNGYTLSSHVNLLGGRQEDFLLKPDENESEAHFFLIKAIEEHLQLHTKSVKLFNTTKPDIVFKDKEGEVWAIEVETGSKKDKKMLDNKVNTLNKNLGEKWFFVVTDKKVKKQYEKYGETLTRFDVPERLIGLFQPKNSKGGAK